jgi:hypothetical protein
MATWMPLVITYVPLWGHNIGIILQLYSHYGATIWGAVILTCTISNRNHYLIF